MRCVRRKGRNRRHTSSLCTSNVACAPVPFLSLYQKSPPLSCLGTSCPRQEKGRRVTAALAPMIQSRAPCVSSEFCLLLLLSLSVCLSHPLLSVTDTMASFCASNVCISESVPVSHYVSLCYCASAFDASSNEQLHAARVASAKAVSVISSVTSVHVCFALRLRLCMMWKL